MEEGNMVITEDTYRTMNEEHTGYCTDCDADTGYLIEPDAEGRMCEDCGHHTVMGIENALLQGHIEFE